MLHAAFWSRCRIWRLRLHQRPLVAKSAFRVLATANQSNRISGCFFLFLLTLCFFLLHLTTPFLQLDKRSTFAVTPWARLRRVVLGCIYNHKLLRQPSAKPDADAGCYSLGSESGWSPRPWPVGEYLSFQGISSHFFQSGDHTRNAATLFYNTGRSPWPWLIETMSVACGWTQLRNSP